MEYYRIIGKYFIYLNLIGLVFCSWGCTEQRTVAAGVRPAAVVGQFYPGDKDKLDEVITSLLNYIPEQKFIGKLIGVLVPHAGYVYSGPIAAYVYKILATQPYDTIIIVGLSHSYPLGNTAAVYASGAFATPLGQTKIDTKLAYAIIQANPLIKENTVAHQREHCIEVQVPFIQKVMPKQTQIVPILLGNPDPKVCVSIGESIAKVVTEIKNKKRVLILCSADMSHYPGYTDAVQVDRTAINSLIELDPYILNRTITELMNKGIPNLHCVFCAEGAVYTTIAAVKKLTANKVQVLQYANSGDVPAPYGDKSRVVGYVSALFLQTEGDKTKQGGKMNKETKNSEEPVDKETQQELLQLARHSIETYLDKKPVEYRTDKEYLNQPVAVFVTLQKQGRLRGCIGTTVAELPLSRAIIEYARAAAFQDYRFPKVTRDEVKDIHIEISVLSPMSKVKSADDIVPFKHGVVVRQGGRTGLFLPQVWDQIPGKEDFLAELCHQKAGLNPQAWQDRQTELYVFTVFSFQE